jgi:pilus assembly protein CpaF
VAEIRRVLEGTLNYERDWTDREVKNHVTAAVLEKARVYGLDTQAKKQMIEQLFNGLRRMDLLQPLLEDESVTDIMVNGPNHVFVERGGRMLELSCAFEDPRKLEDLIQLMAAAVNREINEASPLVDARLADGSRIGAVLPPVALDGPMLAIRKFPAQSLSMADLLEKGTLTVQAADFLEKAVADRRNIFISGGTSSGKTTLLNVLSNSIPKDQRVVTIEDAAELKIEGVQNLVRLEARPPNTEGKGAVSIRDLIRMALRLRPDRIVVGEVRGAEALDMLQAMNTGHEGSLSTGHANSARDMLNRIETMVLMGSALPLEAIRQQMASSLDMLVHLARMRDGSRKIVEIADMKGLHGNEIELETVFAEREGVMIRVAPS